MVCKTTLFNVVFAILLGVLYALVGRPAYGMALTLEVKPLPALTSIVPGSYGYGLEIETALSPQLAVYGLHTQLRSRVPEETLAEIQSGDAGAPDTIPVAARAVTLLVGVRWYAAEGDTWYATLGGGLSRHENAWALGEERYTDRYDALLGTAGAGYRWLWESGFSVRAGVGALASHVRERDVAGRSSATGAHATIAAEIGESEPTGRTQVRPSVDFGLGYRL